MKRLLEIPSTKCYSVGVLSVLGGRRERAVVTIVSVVDYRDIPRTSAALYSSGWRVLRR